MNGIILIRPSERKRTLATSPALIANSAYQPRTTVSGSCNAKHSSRARRAVWEHHPFRSVEKPPGLTPWAGGAPSRSGPWPAAAAIPYVRCCAITSWGAWPHLSQFRRAIDRRARGRAAGQFHVALVSAGARAVVRADQRIRQLPRSTAVTTIVRFLKFIFLITYGEFSPGNYLRHV